MAREIAYVHSFLGLQVMLVDSSLQPLPPVPVISSPSDVLLLGTVMGSPSGEWVGAVIGASYSIVIQVTPLLLVDLAMYTEY